jgi:hypothetical protein
MRTPARILAALFQGGGNIPLLMPILDRLIARGHAVRIMVGPAQWCAQSTITLPTL